MFETISAETITDRGEDFINCLCGNGTHLSGYSSTDAEGNLTENNFGPTPDWDGDTTTCRECGRVFSWSTGVVFNRIDPIVFE